MKLIVIHYHWRMGGVRRVVETGVPAVVANEALKVSEMVFVSGEAADPAWEKKMRGALEKMVPVSFVVEPAFGYVAEWAGSIETLRREIREAARRVLAGPLNETLVLLENPGVGRNLLLGPALAKACAATGARLLCHHHDYFFDGRWERWPEIESCGFGTAAEAIEACFPVGERIGHVAVSPRQAAMLRRGTKAFESDHICPNPVVVDDAHPASDWLRERLQTDAPVWLLPCRLLRRKNILEAVILARLLNPRAVVATTGGPSSQSERAYADALASAAVRNRWPLHLGILAGADESAPSLPGLMRASELVIMPSLFEGFGLPSYEVGILNIPSLVRREALSGGWLDDAAIYSELWIDRGLLDWTAELGRQEASFARWRGQLPWDAVNTLREPWWWHPDAPVPFSRLTASGQIDLLTRWDGAVTDRTLLELNPWTQPGWDQSCRGDRSAAMRFGWQEYQSPRNFAASLAWCLDLMSRTFSRGGWEPFAVPVLTADRLAQTNHYPLLWATET